MQERLAGNTGNTVELLARAASLIHANRLAEAEDIYKSILKLRPHHQAASFNLALIQLRTGRLRAAQRSIEDSLRANPQDAEAHHVLAKILERDAEPKRALYHLQQSVRLRSGQMQPWLDLMRLQGQAGNVQDVRSTADQARQQFADHPDIRIQLAIVLEAAGLRDEAKPLFEAILAATPTQPVVLYHLARIADAEGEVDAALTLFRRARDNDRQNQLPELIIADLELRLGAVEDAIRHYQEWADTHPQHADVHSGRVFAAQYQPGITPERLLALHKAWDARFGHPPRRQPARAPGKPGRSDGRLRIGLVSGDLREHPVGFLTIRAIEALDRSTTQLFAYADSPRADSMTQRFRAASADWRDVAGWSDERLATEIERDRIDVLFDLAGHSSPSRLTAFALHPARVQITWAGYVGTTGLAAMDAILADRFHIPEGEERHYVERVLRMPDSYTCFDPPSDAPDVSELPAGRSDALRFAAFHHPAKINADVVRLWARVLRLAPGSSIRFAYPGFDSQTVQARIGGWFAEAGIGADQLHFEGRLARTELLRRYGGVDLALDPSPYSGGVTTLEALWMGVPVVTMPGRTFAGRHSRSYLSTVGLTEFIAPDADGYVAIVQRWSDDRERLADLRKDLRARVAASPLCDGPRFARHLQTLLRGL